MWWCYRCGVAHEESECEWTEYERFNWLPDNPLYGYTTLRCPWCDSEDELGEAKECAVCGDYFGEDILIGGICPDCFWQYVVPNREDIILGFINENRDCFGEYASEIIKREYEFRDKKKTASSSQLETVLRKGVLQ